MRRPWLGREGWPKRAGILRIMLLAIIVEASVLQAPLAASFGEIGDAITAAQGTYPAAKLPTMCLAIHPNSATPEQNLALLQRLHVSCARSDNLWHLIEPSLIGHYDWSASDLLWSRLCRAGIRPIMIATYNNPLYAAGVFRPIAGEANIAAYAKFTVAMANHYAALCPNMIEELFNEPNAENWTTTPWSGGAYAKVLAATAAAIKKAKPHVTVFSAGVAFDGAPSSAWITNMVNAGASFKAVDAYAFHTYNYDEGDISKTHAPEQMLLDAADVAQKAGASGQRKPVAITEYGFPLPPLDGDLRRQAIYTARGMLTGIIGKYPFLTYYDLIDDGTDYTSRENTFGLFRSRDALQPYEIKPAGLAFSTIMSAMANAKSVTIRYDPKSFIPSIAFAKPNGTTFVAWTYDKQGSKDFFEHIGGFKHVSCRDLFGAAYACTYKDETLSMTLSEPNGPIIVTAVR